MLLFLEFRVVVYMRVRVGLGMRGGFDVLWTFIKFIDVLCLKRGVNIDVIKLVIFWINFIFLEKIYGLLVI